MNNNTSDQTMPDGAYNFSETEKEILKYWQDNNFYKPETNPKNLENRAKYVNILPPLNANGSAHIGHASGFTYQDILGRYHRMRGDEVLLLPGKDHAGIQTEVVFEKELEKTGVNKLTLGREEFYKQCYEYCKVNSEIIRNQEKLIGLSADFDRELFTLDPRVVNTVLDTFVKMYTDKLVYKGSRIVNWCVRCQTTLADIDTDHKEREGKLWYVKYKLKNSEEYLTVATSRPETIMGDTALVVAPDDERYLKLIGKTAIVPIVNREVPIISSYKIDKEFGTGVLKLTPAHANEDWAIKTEWEVATDEKIPALNVIWKDGKMTGPVPEKFKGMKVNAAREEFAKDLAELGLIEKIEYITQNVVICERCKSVIEPLISSQWFIKTDELKKVKDDVDIYPSNMEENYKRWLENLRDWPVSRQLWWGYRLPVWYKGEKSEFVTDDGEVREMILPSTTKSGTNAATPPHSSLGIPLGDSSRDDYRDEGLPVGRQGAGGVELTPENFSNFVKVQITNPNTENTLPSHNLENPANPVNPGSAVWLQDPDVLDTWFSSGQWPYATLMANPGDFEKYYPTTLMETSYDILYLWVSRMVMLGQYRTGLSPFKTVYLHGLITDSKGQKMSKSKGNGIEPGPMQEKYGTDALRWSLIAGSHAGQPTAMYEDKIKSARNFMNKIWNASKFVINFAAQLEGSAVTPPLIRGGREGFTDIDNRKPPQSPLSGGSNTVDQKMLEEIQSISAQYEKCFQNFRFGQISDELYQSFWFEFCDKYIEAVKGRIGTFTDRKYERIESVDADQARAILNYSLKQYLKMLHPFIPFVTEKIWQFVRKDESNGDFESLMYSS